MKYRQWTKLILVAVLVVLCITPAPVTVTHAQGGMLAYGTAAAGSITASMPLVLYSFSGGAGDLVRADVYSLSGALEPLIDLLGPDRQIIASGRLNALSDHGSDAFTSVYLPQAGTYSLMIGGANGTQGDYVVQLRGRTPVSATPLTFGEPVAVTIGQNALPQHFTFLAEECPTTLVAYRASSGTPYTYPFIVKVRDERAQEVATLRGGETLEDRVTVAPLSGQYEAEVWSDDPSVAGSLSLVVACAGDAPPCVTDSAGTTACRACPDCEEFGVCAGFEVSMEVSEHSVVTLTWPAVEGANAAIVSITDEIGELIYARMIEGDLQDIIDLNWWGIGPGTYEIIVTVGSEILGYTICGDTRLLEFEGQGPVEWGVPETDECTVDIVAPRDTMANGLQTFFWTDVPGAESYRLRVYGQFDAVVADGAISAHATSMTLDVSDTAIGAGYGGENEFYVQINAYRGGESWCANGVRVTRNP